MNQITKGFLGVAAFVLVLALVIGICQPDNPAPSVRERPTTYEQLTAAREVVTNLEAMGAVTNYSNPHSIIVGRSFSLFDFEQKRVAVWSIGVVRRSQGLDDGFMIRDAMTNKMIGSYVSGHFDWDGD